MKFATIALASAFVLSSTFALAYTNHHKHRTHHGTTYRGTVGMGGGQYGRGSTVGTPAGGWYGPRGGHAPGDTGTYGTDPMGR
jgi:hypothetical protein